MELAHLRLEAGCVATVVDDVVGGRELVIAAPGASSRRRYVQALTLDGAPLTAPHLDHAQLTSAARLEFELTDAPTAWGRDD